MSPEMRKIPRINDADAAMDKRLAELAKRAEKRRNDPNLRHTMMEKDKEIYNQNAKDMQKAQFEAIDSDNK
jgi:arginine/lysine/ornithine decarboxylase